MKSCWCTNSIYQGSVDTIGMLEPIRKITYIISQGQLTPCKSFIALEFYQFGVPQKILHYNASMCNLNSAILCDRTEVIPQFVFPFISYLIVQYYVSFPITLKCDQSSIQWRPLGHTKIEIFRSSIKYFQTFHFNFLFCLYCIFYKYNSIDRKTLIH